MQFEPINLSELAGVIFGCSIVIIPMLGLTLRFCLKPLIESYGRAFPQAGRLQLELERLSRRVQELEDDRARGELPAKSESMSMTVRARDAELAR